MKKIGIVGNRSIKNYCNYTAAVVAAGDIVVELDPYEENPDIHRYIAGIDGLIIPGGVDIDPSYYNEENNACEDINPRLDAYEIKALEEAVKLKIPVLGICRGHQLINVFFKGTLYQNIFCCDFHKRYKDKDRVHCTKVDPKGFVYDVYKNEKICVNSAHHQAIKDLGEDLIPVQYSEEGLIEAIQHKYLPIFGVQWHPERMCLANKREDTVSGLDLIRYFALNCEGVKLGA